MNSTQLHSMQTLPFGLQSPLASWLPHTPRDPYIQEFWPNPKDTWMVDLRLASSREAGLHRHDDSQESMPKYKKYMPRVVSEKKKQQRKLFIKLMQGGEAKKMMGEQAKMEEGQVFRPCRLFTPSKYAKSKAQSPIPGSNAPSSLKKVPNTEQKRGAKLTFARDSSGESDPLSKKRRKSMVQRNAQVSMSQISGISRPDHMNFEEEGVLKLPIQKQVWNDMAVKIISKSKAEMKDFVSKVANYQNTPSDSRTASGCGSNLRQSRLSGVSPSTYGNQPISNKRLQQMQSQLNPQAIQSNPNVLQLPGMSALGLPGCELVAQKSFRKYSNQLAPQPLPNNYLVDKMGIQMAKKVTTLQEEYASGQVLLQQMQAQEQQQQQNENIYHDDGMTIEQGHILKNGGQQFYESLLRHQKLISELSKNPTGQSLNGNFVSPRSVMLSSQEQIVYSEQSKYSQSMANKIALKVCPKRSYFNTRQFDSKVVASTVVDHMKMSDRAFFGQEQKPQQRAKLYNKFGGAGRSMRITAAGIETQFSHTMQPIEQQQHSSKSARAEDQTDVLPTQPDSGYATNAEQENQDQVQSLDYDAPLDDEEAAAHSDQGVNSNYATAISTNNRGGLSFRPTKSYYQQQEQLYGTSQLEVQRGSLIARAHGEYRRMQEEKDRERILDENKRRLILKID
ncbi:hypothetical protein FGO68_gene4515 [Halteria grandinella]|uniref:Uncharacterized protein n=1 Tax=Halteria grandinella TaxID=5974 RepID=A0A8J8NF94_HALGN|nr:hypothetical protein FGO68_gene4515 [Halteria grandinella]